MRSAASSRASRGEIQDHSGSTESDKGNLTQRHVLETVGEPVSFKQPRGVLVNRIGFAILSSNL